MSQEQRKTLRRNIRIPVFIWGSEEERRAGAGQEVVTKNLSATGLAFYSKKVYPIDMKLPVEIFLPSRKSPVNCKARIMNLEALPNKEEYLLGAQFMDLNEEDQLLIASSVDKMDLYLLLDNALKGGASDLHLTVGRPPLVRCDGRLFPMAAEVVEEGQVEAMLYPLLTEQQLAYFEEKHELDFAFSPDVGQRFRVNMHKQKGFVEAAIRSVATSIRSFAELGLPEDIMEQFCSERSGLILIAGITGAGKTTTMSSMVDFMNQTQERVIITIEDPIEYTLKSEKSIVKQRELGTDTFSYAEALRRSLRQDPDVICVGELLDGDSLLAALRAAETGHLVITTIHAPSTIAAIERLVNLFPVEHALNVRQQLSSCLVGIIYQSLLPGRMSGRVLATEVLINNNAMRHLIREGQYSQMTNVLQTGRQLGMYTIHNHLQKLVKEGLVEEDVAGEFLKKEYA